MKKFYVFLLAMLAIPMSILAQTQTHVFPEVTIQYLGETYVIPAWDALTSGESNVAPYGGARVQNTFEKTDPEAQGKTEYYGKIVATYCALSQTTGRPKGEFTLTDDDDRIIVSCNGKQIETRNISTLKYRDILGEEFAHDIYLLSQRKITGAYVIPQEATAYSDDEFATKYKIIEVGDGAYANKTRSQTTTAYFQATSVTIPIHIKKLGKYSFMSDGYLTKFQFEDLEGVQVTSFPEGLFADCIYLVEVTIPSQITNIGANAFGGCVRLSYVYPNSTTSPTIHNDAFKKYDGSPVAYELVVENCVVWGLSHQMVRNYRNDTNNPVWKDIAFRIPIDIPASGYASFYSDQPVFGKVPAKTSDTKPTWADNSDGIDVIYLGSKTSSIWKGITKNTNGTYAFPKWTWSANKSKAIHDLGLVIYNPTGNGEKLTNASIFSPALTSTYYHTITSDKDLMKGDVENVDMDGLIELYPDNMYFILKNGQFVRCTGGTLAAYKAYLEIPKSYFEEAGIRIDSKDISIEFSDGEETDGIVKVENGEWIENSVIYDMQGRVVSTKGIDSLPKGMYILNGKKFVKQ